MATHSLRNWLCLLPLLGACTDDPRPDDPIVPTATASGVVEIDNAIVNATVFIDYNADNLLDSYEPRTTTDATGHFSLTWETTGRDPHTIAAIAQSTAGFELHMQAPLADALVISPLTTLVVSEMAADPTLTRDAAEAKIASALTASQMTFEGTPNVMADYTAYYATSQNSRQLRYVASAVAAIVSTSVAKCNEVQSVADCNDAMFTVPAIVAMNKQLTTIATGTHMFTEMPATQQADVQANPSNYRGFFMDTTTLSDDIEAALIEMALDFIAALFEYFKQEFAATLEEALIEMVVDQLVDMIA